MMGVKLLSTLIRHTAQQIRAPFLAGFLGQQTNSTPEKTSMPQGRSMAKLLTFRPRSAQASAAVRFHLSKFQHLVWLWMWSKRQCSGTRRASDWKGPAGKVSRFVSIATEFFSNVQERLVFFRTNYFMQKYNMVTRIFSPFVNENCQLWFSKCKEVQSINAKTARRTQCI